MAISVGSKAPDFTLKSKNASGLVDVTLSAAYGNKNTLLLFFPLAFTSVCTKEMCDLTAGLGAYGVLLDAVRAVIAQDNPGLDAEDAADLCWSTMQGLLVLYPNMTRKREALGLPVPSLEDRVVRFTRMIIDGLRAR